MVMPRSVRLSRRSSLRGRFVPVLMVMATMLVLMVGSGHADNETDPVVAQVNGQPIRTSELSRRLSADFGKTILDQMVNESIVAQEAQRLGVAVTEAEVDAELQEYISKLPVGTSLDKSLKEQGLGPASLREQLRTFLRLKKMVQDKIQPIEKEITERYRGYVQVIENPDQYRISVIYIKDKAKALNAREMVRQGEDFGQVARTHSEDASAAFGGDVGWRGPEEMDSFRDSLRQHKVADFKIQKDQVSDLVEAPDGYWIFKITDFRPGKRMSDKEVRARVKQMLIEERLMGEMNNKLNELRRGAQVTKSPPYDK